MVGICVNVINLDLFFRFLKGQYHGNQFYGKTWVCVHVVQPRLKLAYNINTSTHL